MQPESVVVPVELREADGDNPARIVGTLLPIGRVATDRQEIFVPGSVQFPASGVRLLLEHRGREVMRFTPVEDATAAEWRIDAELPDTPEGIEAAALVKSGQRRPALSVEFFALSDQAGVDRSARSRSAFIEAAALCREGVLRPGACRGPIARDPAVALTADRGAGRGDRASRPLLRRSPGRDSHRGDRAARPLDRQIPR